MLVGLFAILAVLIMQVTPFTTDDYGPVYSCNTYMDRYEQETDQIQRQQWFQEYKDCVGAD